jgi:hypothetical protein
VGLACFWGSVFFSFVAYINVACRSPGYVARYTSDTEQHFASNNSYTKDLDPKNKSNIELRSKKPTKLRLDSITVMDSSTHVASSPNALSPKL